MVGAVLARLAQRHRFDQGQVQPFGVAPAQHWQDFIIIDALERHHVDLDRQSRRLRRFQPGEHRGNIAATGDMGKARWVAAVQTDIDPAHPCVGQHVGMVGQLGAIGRQRQFVQPAAQMPPDPAHQIANIAPHQRLAASQPDLVDAARYEQVGQQRDLLQREHLIFGQELHLFRHAIAATQVAAVRDGYAQIADPAAQAVGHLRARRVRHGHGNLARRWTCPAQGQPGCGRGKTSVTRCC